jgi:hypothetical protein
MSIIAAAQSIQVDSKSNSNGGALRTSATC